MDEERDSGTTPDLDFDDYLNELAAEVSGGADARGSLHWICLAPRSVVLSMQAVAILIVVSFIPTSPREARRMAARPLTPPPIHDGSRALKHALP